MEETGENHWLVASYWQTLSHNVVSAVVGKIESCWDVLLKKKMNKKKESWWQKTSNVKVIQGCYL